MSERQEASRLGSLGGKGAEELVLLLQSLEATVTVLGRGVDELDVEGLEVGSLGGGDNALSESDGSLARTADASLDHHPVLVHLAVVGEATHRRDVLLGEVDLGGAAAVVSLLADAKHSLVDLGTVMVTLLTSTSDSEAHAGRMPGTNTGHLTKTSVGLSGQSGDTPTGHNTLGTVTAGGAANVKSLSLGEDGVAADLLLEKSLGEVNLLGNLSTVDLDLHQVGNLLAKLDLADLSVGKHTHDLAVGLDAVELVLNILGLLGKLLGVLGESLSLRSVPVLVESALHLVRQVTSPDSGEGAKTVGSLDVTNNANNSHGRSLKDSHSLHSVLLVELGTGSLDLTNDVGHTGLESHEGSQVHRGRGISILGEGTDATTVVLSSLLGKVLERTMTGLFELTVRHLGVSGVKWIDNYCWYLELEKLTLPFPFYLALATHQFYTENLQTTIKTENNVLHIPILFFLVFENCFCVLFIR